MSIKVDFERKLKLKGLYENLSASLIRLQKLDEDMVDVIVGQEHIGQVDDTDDEDMRRLRGIVTTGSFKKELYEFLVGINFPADRAEELIRIISRAEEPSKIAGYLLNRTLTLSSIVDKAQTAKSISSKLLGTKKVANELWGFNWSTTPSQGPGEIYLSLVLADGRRPSGKEKGDVRIGDQTELEVKGPNGRLSGQSGYGDAKEMTIRLWEVGEKIWNNKKDFGIKEDISYTDFIAKPNAGELTWNINKTGGRNYEDMLKKLAQLVNKKGKFSKTQIQLISIYTIEAFNFYLKKLDVNKYGTSLLPAINQDGSLNTEKWHDIMVNIYFDYYYALENFQYIAFNRSDGKFLIVSPSAFSSLMKKGVIYMKTPPSFGAKAGSQGGTYGISLR
tara:strand:+ start:200 stop:1369 length:1170 start_codon:yes stop_codon:yes gene_type:complete